MTRPVLEALMVSIVGIAVALVANLVSPRGLSLSQDYFPQPATGRAEPAKGANIEAAENGALSRNVATSGPAVDGSGGRTATLTSLQAQELFQSPEYTAELTIFIDARDDRHYQAGHIPGAYQLDRYYPQNHLPTVLPACLNATRIVVYCTGGQCEDSHFAAQLLQDAGIPAERLSIYSGGITEWEAQGLPIEIGSRKSGNVREKKP
jgi:rhodanese-related sulfurtransferase